MTQRWHFIGFYHKQSFKFYFTIRIIYFCIKYKYCNFIDLLTYFEMLKKIGSGLQAILRMCDLFAASEFIKYKGESDFKTATGGFFSIAILTIFAVLFTSMAIRTVDREIINWTSETTNQIQPSPYNLTTSPSPFLFTVGLFGINVNDPAVRYFDFTLTQRKHIAGIEQPNTTIPLIPCTEQHFSITDSLKQSFHKLPASTWLCPPIGSQFLLSGKFTSQVMDFLDLSVRKCNPALSNSRPCANSTMMQQMEAQIGQFILTQFFINPLLNPGNANYLDYYLEDRNFIAFTSHLGAYSNIHIQQYTVITDESILPFTVPKEQSGVIIPDLFQNINFEVTSDLLATLFFYKSSTSTTYNRSFYKIDQFFSYVGGLVGVIMGGMMLLSSYNQDCFQLTLARDLFHKSQATFLSKFNLAYYILLYFQSFFKKFSEKCENWANLKRFEEVKEEIGKQLDISLILTRLLFLQRSIQVIFEKGQFQAMHLNQKPTLENIKTLRNYYRMREIIKFSNTGPPLDETEGELKIGLQPIEQQSQQGDNDSDDEEFPEELKDSFKQSIRQFQVTVSNGNKTSLKIQKGIKWKNWEIEFDNLHEEKEKNRNKQKSQILNSEQQEKPDQPTQILRVNPLKQSSINLNHEHFEFITYLQ